MDIAKNTVSSKGQVKEYDIVRPVERGGEINVLFLGNSITRHAPAPEIGWDFDWGMSASAEEKDYVHVAVKLLEEKYNLIEESYNSTLMTFAFAIIILRGYSNISVPENNCCF